MAFDATFWVASVIFNFFWSFSIFQNTTKN